MMTRWQPLIDRYAQQERVPPMLIAKMTARESGGNPRAVSSAGAKGLMQLMPGTARDMGVTDPFDPEQNIRAGVTYYAKLRDQFGPRLAVAAYHSGPGTVEQIGGDVSRLGPQGRAYYAALAPYADEAPPQPETRSAPMMQPMPLPPMPEEEKPGLFGQLAGHPLFNMGLGVLAANTGHGGQFAPAFGQGALNGMANYQMQQRTAIEQRRLQEVQRLARYRLQNEAQSVAAVEEFIQKLPPEQQALARVNPDEFSKLLMKRQIGPDLPTYGLQPHYETDEKGGVYAVQYASDGTRRETKLGRKPFAVESRTPEYIAAQAGARETATQEAKAQAEFEERYSGDIAQFNDTMQTVEGLSKMRGLGSAVGWQSAFPTIPGGAAKDYELALEQLKGQNFLANIARMKGLGALSDAEGRALKEAATDTSVYQSEEQHKRSLAKLYANLQRGQERIRARKLLGKGQEAESAGDAEIAAAYRQLFGGAKAPSSGKWKIEEAP